MARPVARKRVAMVVAFMVGSLGGRRGLVPVVVAFEDVSQIVSTGNQYIYIYTNNRLS